MAVWPGASLEPPPGVAPVEPVEQPKPATKAPPTPPVKGRRSTVREAQERLLAAADPAVQAMMDLAGIGVDKELAARDEGTRARLLMDVADRVGLRVPQRVQVEHLVTDMSEALAQLERLQSGGDVLELESAEEGDVGE